MSTLSSDAAYRTAYILMGSGATPESGRRSGQFCPEPPPDVAQSIAAALSGSAAGTINAPTGQTGGELAIGFDKAIATEVSALLKRSQGLQFYRDQAFYTCVAFLNGVLDEAAYEKKLGANADLGAQLIALEVIANQDVSEIVEQMKSANEKLKALQTQIDKQKTEQTK